MPEQKQIKHKNFKTKRKKKTKSTIFYARARNTIKLRPEQEQTRNKAITQAKANGVHCGRYKGTTESKAQFLKKYQKVVDALKRGLSIRECVKVYEVSLGTVAKVRKYIKEELEVLEAA